MCLPPKELVMFTLFCIYNTILIFTGLVLVIVGAAIQASYTNYDPVLDRDFFSLPVLLIVIGCFLCFVSFFGLYGASKGSYFFLVTFCVLLCLIFIAEVGGGIAGFVLRDRVSEVLQLELSSSMHAYNKTLHFMWDEIQTNLKCCGDSSSEQWINILNYIPESCCEIKMKPCVVENAYKVGCMVALTEFLKSKAGILGGITFVVFAIQICGILLARKRVTDLKRYEVL